MLPTDGAVIVTPELLLRSKELVATTVLPVNVMRLRAAHAIDEFAGAATVALVFGLSDCTSSWFDEVPVQVNAFEIVTVAEFANCTFAGVVNCNVAIVGPPDI